MNLILSLHYQNVLSAKNKTNGLLIEWIESNGYYCHHLLKSYSNSNYQRKKQKYSIRRSFNNKLLRR